MRDKPTVESSVCLLAKSTYWQIEMSKSPKINLALMEGRTFILGREGHIFVDSTTASKHHAEISIIDGGVYLRDLNSTNGTFLLKNAVRVPFEEGFVDLQQPIVIGGKTLLIQDLLMIAKDFAAVDDAETEVEVAEKPNKNPSDSDGNRASEQR